MTFPYRFLEAAAAALAASALGVSLENLYFLPLIAVISLVRPPERTVRRFAAAILAAGAASVLAGLMLLAAQRAASEGFYRTWGDENYDRPAGNIAENLQHCASKYRGLENPRSPTAHAFLLYRVFVPCVRAQSSENPERYRLNPSTSLLRSPANAVHLALLAALGALSAAGWVRDRDRLGKSAGVFALLALVTILERHVLMASFAARQPVLFAPPTIFAFWVVLGPGLDSYARGSTRRTRTVALLFAGLLAVLAASNGMYLFSMRAP